MAIIIWDENWYYAAANMSSTPTVEVIKTSLTWKQEEVIRRPTPEL